jgi:hypothetical protein
MFDYNRKIQGTNKRETQMNDFVNANWEWLLGVLGFVISYALPTTRVFWVIILKAFLTEAAFIRVFIWFGDKLVASTKNSLDNTLWRPAREALIKKMNG